MKDLLISPPIWAFAKQHGNPSPEMVGSLLASLSTPTTAGHQSEKPRVWPPPIARHGYQSSRDAEIGGPSAPKERSELFDLTAVEGAVPGPLFMGGMGTTQVTPEAHDGLHQAGRPARYIAKLDISPSGVLWYDPLMFGTPLSLGTVLSRFLSCSGV